ncbi:MAG: MATE family efflux transporter [Oscillospiraceae bacterium]|nr:MATE family efflux transporter [Oscillospiraceae bacterium]
MNRDLTSGKPSAVLWRFCLPLFGSMVFQQLYSIADSLVAGKFISENALAAVGNSYEVTLIFIAFAFGCNIGCSVVVSRYFGAGEYVKVRSAVTTSLILCGAVCAVLMLLGLMLTPWLLEAIRTPTLLLADSRLYLDIYIWGLPFVFFYNLSTGIFSALGDSRTPFIFLVSSSLANIAMDIWFVAGLGMKVAGVAWATFICQGVSCVLALVTVFRRLGQLKVPGRAPLFSVPILRQTAMIAVPSVLQQSFISVGNIIIQRVINGFGPEVIAGYSAAIKLNNLVITSFSTLGNGVSNFTSQNLGAGKPERIPQGFRAGRNMVWLISLPIIVLYFFGGELCLRFFIEEPTQEAIRSGLMFLRIVSPFYLMISVKIVTDGILRGAGLMWQFMISTFTDLVLRVVLAAVLAGTSLGCVGIWLAWPIGWLAALVISVSLYKAHKWES